MMTLFDFILAFSTKLQPVLVEAVRRLVQMAYLLNCPRPTHYECGTGTVGTYR
jgi:hypothetical protein